jgi:uroporphyrinogen decarboxylase
MTKREIVKMVLNGQKPPYVPFSHKFTIEPKKLLMEQYGVDDLDEVLGNHILQLGSDIGFFDDLGNDQFQDVFKVIWDRSIYKDIGDAKGILHHEPTLKGYQFPNPLDPRFLLISNRKLQRNLICFEYSKLDFHFTKEMSILLNHL